MLRRFRSFFLFCVKVLIFPFIAGTMLEKKWNRGESIFQACAQFFSLFPGRTGVYIRTAFYSTVLHECSPNVHIEFGSYFSHRKVTLQDNVYIGAYCILGQIEVGRKCIIGSRVSIPSGKRQHFDDTGKVGDEVTLDTVKIGERCWIGEGAVVLDDVGAGSVVAAGAVVTAKVPENVIVGGNPHRIIKSI